MNQEEWAASSRINEARNVFHHHQDTCLGKQQHSLMVRVPSLPLHGDQDSARQDSSRSFTSSGWRSFLLTLFSSETPDLLLCGVSFKFTVYLHRDSLSFLLPLCHFKVFHYPLVLQYMVSPPRCPDSPPNKTVIYPELSCIIEEDFPLLFLYVIASSSGSGLIPFCISVSWAN